MIKCLLIVPNPESALNEEAGKLLLEAYEDYSSRAKMMTQIHAQVNFARTVSTGVNCPHVILSSILLKQFMHFYILLAALKRMML